MLPAERFALAGAFKGEDVVPVLKGRGCREKVQLFAGRIEPAQRQPRGPRRAGIIRTIEITRQRRPFTRNTDAFHAQPRQLDELPEAGAALLERRHAARVVGRQEKLCRAIVIARPQERLSRTEGMSFFQRLPGKRLHTRRRTLPGHMPTFKVAFSNLVRRRQDFADFRATVHRVTSRAEQFERKRLVVKVKFHGRWALTSGGLPGCASAAANQRKSHRASPAAKVWPRASFKFSISASG